MNLDNYNQFPTLDPQNMLSAIDGLPGQLDSAWQLGQSQSLPAWGGLQRILVSGMGGSAIGADLLSAYVEPLSPVPIFVHRDYGLPAWAKGPQTLVIVSSHSGNTEETLSGFEAALASGCRVLAITTGGKLAAAAQKAASADHALWTFERSGQPRAAVGFSFSLLLASIAHLHLIPDPTQELQNATAAMRIQQSQLQASVPIVQNPAKRMAGQWMGRWVTVLGSGVLTPVARRWKGQISELAKAWGQFEALPEADHNTLAGTQNPEEILSHMFAMFLNAPSDHPRNRLRSNLTRHGFMVEGINTDAYQAQGDTPLAHLWTALHFGDYAAYYLAMLYDIDPTPVSVMENLKLELAKHLPENR
jgi:glucose/mannose-6-phosphate isomerase